MQACKTGISCNMTVKVKMPDSKPAAAEDVVHDYVMLVYAHVKVTLTVDGCPGGRLSVHKFCGPELNQQEVLTLKGNT